MRGLGAAWVVVASLAVTGAAHEIVEGLVFADNDCQQALGRMQVVADGRCRCLDCGRWEDEGVATATTTATLSYSTPGTATVTDTLRKTTPTATDTATLEGTRSMTVEPTVSETYYESPVLIYASDAVGYHAFEGVGLGINCTECDAFPLTIASAKCHSNNTFTIAFGPDLDECKDTHPIHVPVDVAQCVYIGSGYFAMLAKSTCQLPDDDDMTSLEIVLIVILILGTALLGLVVGYAVWVWKKLGELTKLCDDVQKAAKEDKNLQEQCHKTKEDLTKQVALSSKVADQVEGITGNSVLTNGVIGAANSIVPPTLPLREEIDQLAAQMAEVEAEIDMQKKMHRDAMI